MSFNGTRFINQIPPLSHKQEQQVESYSVPLMYWLSKISLFDKFVYLKTIEGRVLIVETKWPSVSTVPFWIKLKETEWREYTYVFLCGLYIEYIRNVDMHIDIFWLLFQNLGF